MSYASNGDAGFASGSDTYINGSKINLNTGSVGLIGSIRSVLVAQVDTLFDAERDSHLLVSCKL